MKVLKAIGAGAMIIFGAAGVVVGWFDQNLAPLLEYYVCSGTVEQHLGKDYIKMRGTTPAGNAIPWYYKPSEVGKAVFYTQAEAEELAEQMTNEHERKWSWTGAPEFPMRRTWRKKENARCL